jgi:serine/threonine protein kinase
LAKRKLPSRIGRYEIVDRLGEGGMGLVYLARDPSLQRTVAIKVLSWSNEELQARFAREARSAASLRHHNIVTIYDIGEDGDKQFLAMEYIDGETLADVIRRKAALPTLTRLQLMQQLCSGLAYAHRLGIIHRDIKPANLMVTSEGLLKILDFGLARMMQENTATGITQTGALMGTPQYMSPEQVEARPVDHRSDIFSVGLVFYELLTYTKAYEGGAPHEVLYRIAHDAPVPMRERNPEIDARLEAIVARAIERLPEHRYQTLELLSADLERFCQTLDRQDETAQVIRPGADVPVEPARPISGSAPKTPGTTPRPPNLEAISKRREAQIRAHLDKAARHLANHEHQLAIDECELAAGLDPDAPRVLELLTRAHDALDDSRAGAWVKEARERLDSGALSDAEQLIHQALQIRPASEDAQALRRELIARQREFDQAEERARAVRSMLGRARASLAEGALEAALRSTADALVHEPGNPEAIALKQQLLQAIQQRRESEERERLAVTTVAKARQLAAGGDFDAALALLRAGQSPHALVQEAMASIATARDAHAQRRRDEAEAARRRAEEEEARRREAQRRLAEEEQARRRAVDEEARRREAQRRLAEEEQARRRDEENRRRERDAARAAEAALARARTDEPREPELETPSPRPERDRISVIPPRPVSDRRPWPLWIVGVSVTVLAIVAVGSVLWMTGGPAPQPPPQPQVFHVEVERPSGGIIRIGGQVCGGDLGACRQSFPQGYQVELRAEAAPDYEFRSFTGDCASDQATLRKTMTADMRCGATFTRKPAPPPPGSYTLAIRSQVGGVVEGDGFTCRSTGGDCTKDLVARTAVTLRAKPDADARFDGWRGGCVANRSVIRATTLRITVDRNVDCVAMFSSTLPPPGPEISTTKPPVPPVGPPVPPAPVTHTLTFNLPDHGSLQIPDRLNCGKSGTDCDVQAPAGTQLAIQVTAEADYMLQQSSCGEWSQDRITLRVETSRTCTVTFIRDPAKVAPKPPVAPGPSPAEVAARQEIADLITRYGRAIASRRVSDVAALYESYGARDREREAGSFRTYSTIEWVQRAPAAIDLSPDQRQATATVSVTKTLVDLRSQRPTTNNQSYTFDLVLTPGGWKIRTFSQK